jgi:hypothetical protein
LRDGVIEGRSEQIEYASYRDRDRGRDRDRYNARE